MIPVTDEDRLKLMVYRQVKSDSKGLTFQEYLSLVRATYEKAKYAGKKIRFAAQGLEEQLFLDANTWLNTPENKRRDVDVSALRKIKSAKKCKGNDPVGISYFRMYNEMKKSLGDLNNGIAYIEDQEEIIEETNGFSDDSLEGQLIKLAQKYKSVFWFRKRNIDKQAYMTIRRCASCKNSRELLRYYYNFYKEKSRCD